MTRQIAYCGLDCANCPSYLATQKNDDAMREEHSRYLKNTYGMTVPAQEINCDGCLSSSGTLLTFCQSCGIRKCAGDKGVVNCGECVLAPCEKLDDLHRFSAAAKAAFKALAGRGKINGEISRPKV